MDTKFTPGPWTFTEGRKTAGLGYKPVHVITSGKKQIASFSWNDDSPWFPTEAESKANAHLIAAAPAMLGVLQEVFEEFDNRYDGADDSRTKWMGELLEKSRWVIHKATGGAA